MFYVMTLVLKYNVWFFNLVSGFIRIRELHKTIVLGRNIIRNANSRRTHLPSLRIFIMMQASYKLMLDVTKWQHNKGGNSVS